MEIYQPSWRGRDIKTRKEPNGGKYIAMVGPKSLLYVPVNVEPNKKYKLTIDICRESGNGDVFCNIYGNKRYDFPQSKISLIKNQWATYDVDLITKDFPKTLPLVFRIWQKGTGTISVRRIIIDLDDGEAQGSHVIAKGEPVPTPPNPRRKKLKEPERFPNPIVPKKNPPRHYVKPKKAIVYNNQPKIAQNNIETDGVKVSVIISSRNRVNLFKKTLYTLDKQTLGKQNFEIIILDDKSTEDLFGLCHNIHNDTGLRIQYICFDRNKGDIKPKTWTPALSNNIGFKLSRGSVIIISGQETLLHPNSLEISYNKASEGYCVYGSVYRSTISFANTLNRVWNMNMSFDDILKINGATYDASPLNGWWWYYMATQKEHIMNIGGVDERFMLGIAGEDDDFANRIQHYGVPIIRSKQIIGVHQDHSREDKKDAFHSWRTNKKEWKSLRNHNMKIINNWKSKPYFVVNKNINWGNLDTINRHEVME